MKIKMNLTAFAAVSCLTVFPVLADVPGAPEASPDVYKVIAENDQVRIVLATWKPGQVDKPHSHPSAAVYTIKGCNRKITKGDGTTDEKEIKSGTGRINPPVKKHTFQNLSKEECQQVLVELKK